MAWRRFVLEPAAEVAPDMLHPGTGWTIARLLHHLNQTPWYLAIAGPIGVGKSCLAGEIAEKNRPGCWPSNSTSSGWKPSTAIRLVMPGKSN